MSNRGGGDGWLVIPGDPGIILPKIEKRNSLSESRLIFADQIHVGINEKRGLVN